MPESRIGNYTYSVPFALGQYVAAPVESVRFSTEFVDTTPMLIEYFVNGPDPSGSRHLTTVPGVSTSFIAVRASGRGLPSTSYGDFDMSAVNISPGSGVSCTRAFLFRIHDFDCAQTRAYDFKIWVSDDTDFLSGADHRVLFESHNLWQSGVQFPVSYLTDQSKFLYNTIPNVPNFTRTAHSGQIGGNSIHGTGDLDVSQWIYVAVAGSGCLSLGEYGGIESSGFRLRVSYDIDNIFVLKD